MAVWFETWLDRDCLVAVLPTRPLRDARAASGQNFCSASVMALSRLGIGSFRSWF